MSSFLIDTTHEWGFSDAISQTRLRESLLQHIHTTIPLREDTLEFQACVDQFKELITIVKTEYYTSVCEPLIDKGALYGLLHPLNLAQGFTQYEQFALGKFHWTYDMDLDRYADRWRFYSVYVYQALRTPC